MFQLSYDSRIRMSQVRCCRTPNAMGKNGLFTRDHETMADIYTIEPRKLRSPSAMCNRLRLRVFMAVNWPGVSVDKASRFLCRCAAKSTIRTDEGIAL
jgi:hypothetical protein